MSDLAIQVERISKRYRIGQQVKYKALRDSIAGLFRGIWKLPASVLTRSGFNDDERAKPDFIWALKDVSFDVAGGEVVGIIGRNGAGKSTLLKILSRITEPTSGEARIHGLVGSILEVGTGFHPELTGRENIYLNGAILGMRRAQIDRKFDEIVAFASVEDFIDTPVKHYSSGMYVRLAFAVAAHLEPEILLVDEVLAVGDMEFQNKCLGKMREVGRSGRTVLFVSHNMPAVTGLCTRAILLEAGQIAISGTPADVVSRYVQIGLRPVSEVRWDVDTAPANNIARLVRVRASDEASESRDTFDIRKPVGIEMLYQVLKPGVWFTPAIQVSNELGITLFNSAEQITPEWDRAYDRPGFYRSTCWIPGNLLAEGVFSVHVTLWGFSRPPHRGVRVDDAIRFHVHDTLEGDSVRGRTTGSYPGIIRPKLEWTSERIEDGVDSIGSPTTDTKSSVARRVSG